MERSVISIAPARTGEDFEEAARLCAALADWDGDAAAPHGLTAEMVKATFHPHISGTALAERFAGDGAFMLLARVAGVPVGCLAVDSFDEGRVELHKFFVNPGSRGRGIGKALVEDALTRAGLAGSNGAVVHTAFYMASALAVYQACGFAPCPRFRATP